MPHLCHSQIDVNPWISKKGMDGVGVVVAAGAGKSRATILEYIAYNHTLGAESRHTY